MTNLANLAAQSPDSALVKMPCSALKGIGPKTIEKLSAYGIYTVQDLLFHLPARYQDRTRLTPIAEARPGDQVLIEVVIEATHVVKAKRPMLICQVRDATGFLSLRFFHFTYHQQQNLKAGLRLRCFGEIRGYGFELEMVHPEYQTVSAHAPLVLESRLTPIYPTTEGLTQRQWRAATDAALQFLTKENALPDFLPKELLQELRLPPLADALQFVHRPPPNVKIADILSGTHSAVQRLAFEELLAHHLSLLHLRNNLQENRAPRLMATHHFQKQFLAQLSFQLTSAQSRVFQEISADIEKNQPMLRLLQGDVGSGKTVVAALCALQALENNYQAALMAPTEILAEQHYRNFSKWFTPLGITVEWLGGKLKAKAREQTLQAIENGQAGIVVGTHALFQEDVKFKALGMVLIDEQHRFGVHQRLALQEKGLQQGIYPHQLIMTATPIPRTLAMTAYADLDHSIIDELPPGRTPVQTILVSDKRRAEVISRVEQASEEKKQIYWVCPLIEESEMLQCQAAETTTAQLTKFLPNVRIGLIHGRMNSSEKEAVMTRFKQAELDLLVATTVIEVGVDVPNASLMIIENAERLGLAQLHQLRGRVGRGAVKSFCVLMYQQNKLSNVAKSRLEIMRETNDGFKIAERDLEIRGPGEVLGTRQSGIAQLKIADLMRDKSLLPRVHFIAEKILHDHSMIVPQLIARWIGKADKYVRV